MREEPSSAYSTIGASHSVTSADDYTDAIASVSHHSSDAPVMSGSNQGIAAVEDNNIIIESVPVQVVNVQDSSRYYSHISNTTATLQLPQSTRHTLTQRRLGTHDCAYACHHMIDSTNFVY